MDKAGRHLHPQAGRRRWRVSTGRERNLVQLRGVAPDRRQRLRDLLQERLTAGEDGSITLEARAWAITATVR